MINTHMHTCIHTYIHTYTHKKKKTDIWIHTCMHTDSGGGSVPQRQMFGDGCLPARRRAYKHHTHTRWCGALLKVGLVVDEKLVEGVG